MIAATSRRRRKRSAKLIAAVAPFEQVAVVMHDNPDPDAIATGWAIKYLLDHRTDKPVRLIGGGDIIRAENRQMVRLLQPPLELVDQLQTDEQTAAILVDCGPEATNHLLCSGAILPVAVIDHHQQGGPGQAVSRDGNGQVAGDGIDRAVDLAIDRAALCQLGPHRMFVDIRPRVAASATIAATYLREQELAPPTELATALLYAIRTETRGSETRHSQLDRAVLPWLTRRADPSLLAEIEDAPLTRGYFSDLVLALQSTFVYDDTAFCMLPHAQGPETVGELADLLARCEEVRRVLCAAVFERAVLISVRTDKDAGNATDLLRETISGLGYGGGHEHRAGGKLIASATGDQVPSDVQDDLRTRWLRACGIQRLRGSRLVAKSAIMGNLA